MLRPIASLGLGLFTFFRAYSGAEQREQLDYRQGNRTGITAQRYRNVCGVGGEDCSLCMVSGVASAYWIRWMLVSEDADAAMVYVARGAPRRWYQPSGSPWGIENAPTRFGRVTFALSPGERGIVGSFSLDRRGGVDAAAMATPQVSIHLRSPQPGRAPPAPRMIITPTQSAKLVGWHANNETAVFELLGTATTFNVTADFGSR